MSLNIYIMTYNRAAYLKESMQSVLAQTYSDFALYVLDNCSEDNTTEVIDSFGDKRIHHIRHERNLGSFGNFNFALEHCKADFFIMFHDDDIMEPDLVEKEMKVMQSDPSITVVCGNATQFGDCDEGEIRSNFSGRYSNRQGYIRFLKDGHSLVYPSLLYRNAFIQEHHIRFDQSVGPCSDIVFYYDIERFGGTICEIPDVVMRYRVHKGQDSIVSGTSMHLKLFRYLSEHEGYRDLLLEHKRDVYDRYMPFMFRDFVAGRVDRKTFVENKRSLMQSLSIDYRNKWDFLEKLVLCFSGPIHLAYKLKKAISKGR